MSFYGGAVTSGPPVPTSAQDSSRRDGSHAEAVSRVTHSMVNGTTSAWFLPVVPFSPCRTKGQIRPVQPAGVKEAT